MMFCVFVTAPHLCGAYFIVHQRLTRNRMRQMAQAIQHNRLIDKTLQNIGYELSFYIRISIGRTS